MRIPPYVIWNSEKTIEELIEEENKNPKRWGGDDHDSIMSKIRIDKELEGAIEEKWYKLEDKLEEWKKLFVRKNCNLSTWWLSIDITNKIHPETKKMCIELAKICSLKIAWIDIICEDISKPLEEINGAIIEVNSTPWIRMHHFPSEWKSRNVAKEILELVFV